MKFLFILVYITFFTLMSCQFNKAVFVNVRPRHLQIVTDINNRTVYYYKKCLMEGNYKYKSKFGGILGNYTIQSYSDGVENGMYFEYRKGRLEHQAQYLNGYKDGTETFYLNGVKTSSWPFKLGFSNGDMILYMNEGLDTAYTVRYSSDAFEMNIYVDNLIIMESNRINHINLIMQPCIIKADEYPQRYYLKSDSTLIYECIWHRVDSCYHTNKQYGYKD